MLNFGCWPWVLMEYHSYVFLKGHICAVAYYNVEWAVCILFWDKIFVLTEDLWQLPFCLQGWVLLHFTIATIKSASLLEYSTLSITTVALPLSAGRIMKLSSSCSNLMASLPVFEMFGFRTFIFQIGISLSILAHQTRP